MTRPTISRAEVHALCRSLGADPMQTSHIEIEPTHVTVTVYKLNEQGARYHDEATDDAAVEEHVIPIVGDGNAETVRMRHPSLPGQEIDVRPRGAGQRAMAGWEVVAPEPPPKDPPSERGTQSEAPASTGASSSPAPRRRKASTKKQEEDS
jgi:hypothetical protein